MSCVRTGLAGVDHFVETTTIDWLEVNLRTFWREGLLGIGGWTTVAADSGGKFPVLLPLVDCPTTLQSMRKDWVWHDVAYSGLDDNVWHPVVPPDIYVGGALQPSGSYEIDYEGGTVTFGTAPTEAVTASYSFHNIQVYIANEVPWWRQLQQLSLDFDDNQFQRCDNGDWQIGPHHRIQLPALIISALGNGELIPYGLGRGCVKRRQEVIYHVITEDKCVRDKMVDWILLQDQTKLDLFNPNLARFAGDNPLNCNGTINSGLLMQDLVEAYPGGCARSSRTRLSSADTFLNGIWDAVVQATYEVTIC